MTRRPQRCGHGERNKVERGAIPQRPWRTVSNPLPPIEPLSGEQIEALHQASLRILEAIDIVFILDEALDLLAAAGAEVDRTSRAVRFDRALIEAQIARAPSLFTLHARNPEHHLTIGGNHLRPVTGSIWPRIYAN